MHLTYIGVSLYIYIYILKSEAQSLQVQIEEKRVLGCGGREINKLMSDNNQVSELLPVDS